jgi:hypothetical protein
MHRGVSSKQVAPAVCPLPLCRRRFRQRAVWRVFVRRLGLRLGGDSVVRLHRPSCRPHPEAHRRWSSQTARLQSRRPFRDGCHRTSCPRAGACGIALPTGSVSCTEVRGGGPVGCSAVTTADRGPGGAVTAGVVAGLLSWGSSKNRLSIDISGVVYSHIASPSTGRGAHRGGQGRRRRLRGFVSPWLRYDASAHSCHAAGHVPPVPFLTTSAACSDTHFAGLLHPAADHEVRQVTSPLPGAVHPSESSPRSQPKPRHRVPQPSCCCRPGVPLPPRGWS